MAGADLVGVGIVKNDPTLTGGPGGHFAPRLVASRVGEFLKLIWQKPVKNTIYYQT